MRSVVLSKTAAEKLEKLLEFLEFEWSERVKHNFIVRLDKSLEQICKYPLSYEKSQLRPDLHRCLVTKQTSLFYTFDSKRVFLKNQKEKGTNPEVVRYMVEALEYFTGMSTEEVKKTAFDIAQQGTKGYDPEFTGYKLKSIPHITFSGYQILAYYYVSFAIALPDILMQLQLPYHEEYLLARGVKNGVN